MSKTFTHNGAFVCEFDGATIEDSEYIDFRRYVELKQGESSLCILLTRSLCDGTQGMEITYEIEGHHHEIADARLSAEDFDAITGFKLIDNGNKDTTPALPYGNVIEKGYYYE